MRTKTQTKKYIQGRGWRRALAVLLTFCLAFGSGYPGLLSAYADDYEPVSFVVGENVTAVLADNVLTVSGEGETNDFSPDTVPFREYAAEIDRLVIEEGITYIGAYLFYGLGELSGELVLPQSIAGFGGYAFSGDSKERAPSFTAVQNLFETGTESDSPQEIQDPSSLFFSGQSGSVTCAVNNQAFLDAAMAAGYQIPEDAAGMQGEEQESQEEQAGDQTSVSGELPLPDVESQEAGEEPELQAEDPAAVRQQAAAGTGEYREIYVDQTNGNDSGAGTQENPVRTFDGAAMKMQTSAEGGTVDNNRIVIIGTYQLGNGETELLKARPVPVTITGGTLIGAHTNSDYALWLHEAFRLESISVQSLNHIYGNGYDITIGDGVSNAASGFYLYGSGQNDLAAAGVGKITAYSSNIVRIVGYVRSKPSIDVKGMTAYITIGGTASVSTIIAGSASGAVENADVEIDIQGGTVTTLTGGNQGFNDGNSLFTGKTRISISGGTVGNLLGAGTGRSVSIPTYCGQMDINVTGGKVGNIYGAGSAAFVVSTGDVTSAVNISVTGGEVGNIFAAGKGGDSSVGLTATYPAFKPEMPPEKFGSLTGEANITVGGDALITGNIYASGEGDKPVTYDSKSNAYLEGKAVVTVEGNSTIKGNVYGGGKGISETGYEKCALVKENSQVEILVAGGTVQGNVYGGGQTAETEGSTSVVMAAGNVQGNVYGGGENGLVHGKTSVSLSGGTVTGSVYGGALGIPGERLVYGGSTVNMTGGWVRGNVYGGSELSNDGPEEDRQDDLVFVNLTGGWVSGNVFGGGYQGVIHGSTHLHIGRGALGECSYYMAHQGEQPELTFSELTVDGSVYAGGDYGGGSTVDYSAITVTGTSHVYIDGTGYDTEGGTGISMMISGGVFGSGASCDAGSTRLVTLKDYGKPVKDENGIIGGATRTLTAIQRADRVLLKNAHIQLTGESDVANSNQTALYSLNRIGDHGPLETLGSLGNGLVLQGGSTVILDSAAIETANLKSVDHEGKEVTLAGLSTVPNTVLFGSGIVFRVSYTNPDTKKADYGAVSGYAYMIAEDRADAYAYARVKTDTINPSDGGFCAPGGNEELAYHNVNEEYRYWQVKGNEATADRYAVLTAQTLKNDESGFGDDGYSVAAGSIELPPAEGSGAYTIQTITLPTDTGLSLADAAKDNLKGSWKTSETNGPSGGEKIDLAGEQQKISDSPQTTFGLSMGTGGKVISAASASAEGANTVIGQTLSADTSGSTPVIEFYLTYKNDGIIVSRSLGTVVVILQNEKGAKIALNVEIVTKASRLADQTVDLYATQAGSYTGRLVIPSGESRSLRLTGVEQAGTGLTSAGGTLTGHQFSVTMQPVKSQGWKTSGLMTEPFDLRGYSSASLIGNTDSRYQAPVEFTLNNVSDFQAKTDIDQVTLIFEDETGSARITLNIHWQESVVSDVCTMRGRQYNGGTSQGEVSISQKSAATAVFTLGSATTAEGLWLELRKSPGKTVFPAGTKLTLLGLIGFYSYITTGTETKIALTDFTGMWNSSHPAGNITRETQLTVIMDFGAVESLANGDYSLRLRSNTGADSNGADFTVNNSDARLGMSGIGGYSRGEHAVTLTVSPDSDTRFADGAVAVLSPENGSAFPVGAAFICGEKTYYPSGGKVYVPLEGSGTHTVSMNTEHSAGLEIGEYSIRAELFPCGWNAGKTTGAVRTSSAGFQVTDNPVYALFVSMKDKERVAQAGQTLSFTAEYAAADTGADSAVIDVRVQKKTGEAYEDAGIWAVSGNRIQTGERTQELTVTVPQGVGTGTYRLLFALGDQEVPYNILIN